MKEILDRLEAVFGGQVTVAVVVVVGAYHLILGLLRLIQALRDHQRKGAQIASLKSRFGLLKLMYEIEDLKATRSIQELPLELELQREVASIEPAEGERARPTRLHAEVETKIAAFFEKHRTAARVVMVLTHCVLRGWGIGFLAMIIFVSTFEGQDGIQRTNWINVFMLTGVILLGFLVSNLILRAGRSAGLRDLLRYISYPAGVLLAWVIFHSPLRP
jgi:hypothetical protein